MKHMRIILAMALALMLALPMFALGEEPADEAVQVEEVGEIALPEDPGSPSEETPEEEAPQTDPDAVATYCFIAGDTLVASQAAREGEAILRPEDPAAPEGFAFAGWFLEDETELFVDADGDGEIDPVLAVVDPLCPEINVIARFVEAMPAGDEAEEEATATVPADDATASPEGEASEDARQPSPSEEGDGAEALADEADSPDEAEADEADEADSTDEADADEAGEADSTDEAEADEADEADSTDEADADEADEADSLPALPVANELTYTGEAQALVSAAGEWLYSLDGENYACEIPTAVNAGEYTVYFKAAEDAEAQTLTVVVAKADVVFTPPEAATSEE